MRTRTRRWTAGALSTLLVTGVAVTAGPGLASASTPAQHVLLISVDGLHASDVTQCIHDHLCPNLTNLTLHGTTYANVQTSQPSDSSPGLMALMTGATPALTGVYYDDSYDRTLYPPAAQTQSGTQNCAGLPGAETMYAENIDRNAPSVANGGVGTRPILGDTIDPTQLPYGVVNGKCVPIWPNDFLRTNSIMSVIHDAGLRTAWADKHPAAMQEISGHGTPNTIDDRFLSEINADIIPPSLTDTRGRVVSFPLPNPTGTGPFVITDSVGDTESYDQTKVDAVLNEIDGLNSGGKVHVGTPAIFGMNFQTVSVAEKLVDPMRSCVRITPSPAGCDPNYVPGGYEPGTLNFTPQLAGAIASVDTALGSMVAELGSQGLLNSTKIIITAKHGQSPIDPSSLAKIGHAEDTVLSNAEINVAQTTDDDISLLWLKSQSQTGAAVAALKASQASGNPARIKDLYYGSSMISKFDNPLSDPRTPDIIIQPLHGTIYSTSKAKVAEHGGFLPDDTHVEMVIVNGSALGVAGHEATVTNHVTTMQVAPTILSTLGLDPSALDAVKVQGVQVLPQS